MKKLKVSNSALMIIAAICVIIIFAILFASQRRQRSLDTTQPATQTVPEIKNDSDLINVGSQLDSANIDDIDTQLKQINNDASNF